MSSPSPSDAFFLSKSGYCIIEDVQARPIPCPDVTIIDWMMIVDSLAKSGSMETTRDLQQLAYSIPDATNTTPAVHKLIEAVEKIAEKCMFDPSLPRLTAAALESMGVTIKEIPGASQL